MYTKFTPRKNALIMNTISWVSGACTKKQIHHNCGCGTSCSSIKVATPASMLTAVGSAATLAVATRVATAPAASSEVSKV